MTPAYLTPPSLVVPPRFVPLGSDGATVSAQPLLSSEGGYARFGWRTAREVAAALGGDLPTRVEMLTLYAQCLGRGLVLKPVTLPDEHLIAWAKSQGGLTFGVDAYRNANMMTLAWAKYHDERVADQLEALGWHEDQGDAVFGIGKQWIRPFGPDGKGEVAGAAYLMGWPQTNGQWIQSGVYSPGARPFHDDRYCDYSSCTIVVRRP